jgi:hypothetical protein
MKIGLNKIKTMKERLNSIALWWKFEGRYYHINFINGIKNLWNWFPTIWKDRDWDQSFIYEVLIHKLEKQAKYIGGRDWHTRAQRDAELMLLCARLARIQQEDLYMMEYMDYLDLDIEFVPTDETEKWFTMESTTTRDDLDDYFVKYKRQYELIDKTDKDNHHIAIEIARNNQERSRKLLFKIMEENISGWWD